MASPFPWSLRFFRVKGIQVYVHASWFIVAWIEISARREAYTSLTWNVAEYLGLFLIVLLHEFGHVLACRQVGGIANDIVLWPLGGVALGRPPPRAGAELWTIAAGPLVNVVLYPLLMLATTACASSGMSDRMPDLERLLFQLWRINQLLLIFNLLPIFPLDGGQILRALLWHKIGRARSLLVATSIGFAGIALGAAYRLSQRPDDLLWTAIFALYLGRQCLNGFRQGRALQVLERLPRHAGFACPACHQAPPSGPIWLCRGCGHRFDAFLTSAICPHCRTPLPAIGCVDCGTENPIERWETGTPRRPGDPPVIDI